MEAKENISQLHSREKNETVRPEDGTEAKKGEGERESNQTTKLI